MILNIHGYRGNSDNTMHKILKELFPEEKILSPQIDYDNISPNEIISDLLMYDLPLFGDFNDQELQDEQLDLIVGTSLGGLIAAVVSYQVYTARRQIAVPTVLFNPCLLPWVILPKVGCKDENKYFEADYPMAFAKVARAALHIGWLKNTRILLGENDETVEPDFCERFFTVKTEGLLTYLNCAHSISDNPEAIELVKELIRDFYRSRRQTG